MTEKGTDEPSAVDEYLVVLTDDVREELQRVRSIILKKLPECRERIAYKIIVFSLKKDLVGIASQKNHCSFYTMSPNLVKEMEEELRDYRVSGATLHFTPREPLPESLIVKIVEERARELHG